MKKNRVGNHNGPYGKYAFHYAGLKADKYGLYEYVEDMGKVEKLILPLLYNLMKNPDKDYIYWPKREEIITKQIEKIKDVTRDIKVD